MAEPTRDFYSDAQRQKRKTRLALIVVGVGVAAGVVALGAIQYKHRSDAIAATTASAQAWKLAGPACQTLSAEAYAPLAAKAGKAFQFNGDTYRRRFGHVDCNLTAVKGVSDPVPVCQFTSPGLIAVETAKGEFFFQLGAGEPAAISVVDEVASCVVASNFQPG